MPMRNWKEHLIEQREGPLRIYTVPEPRLKYVVGADTAEGIVRDRGTTTRAWRPGIDENPDFSAIAVVELETARHVATWRGMIEPHEFTEVVAAVGYYYNTAMIVAEVNPPGNEVVRGLYRSIKYPKLYQNRTALPHMVDDHTLQWGWRTSKTSKPALIERIREWLSEAEGPQLTQCDVLLNELRVMVRDEVGNIRAKHPNHDDVAMAFGMALMGRYDHYHPRAQDERPDDMKDLPHNDREIWEAVIAKRELHERVRRTTTTALRRNLVRGRRGRFVRSGFRKHKNGPRGGGSNPLV